MVRISRYVSAPKQPVKAMASGLNSESFAGPSIRTVIRARVVIMIALTLSGNNRSLTAPMRPHRHNSAARSR